MTAPPYPRPPVHRPARKSQASQTREQNSTAAARAAAARLRRLDRGRRKPTRSVFAQNIHRGNKVARVCVALQCLSAERGALSKPGCSRVAIDKQRLLHLVQNFILKIFGDFRL